MRQLENSLITVSGSVAPEFEAVRESFLSNFEQGQEVGAGVAVYHRGKLVVDLAGGLRDRVSGKRYSHEILQPVFSVTKGLPHSPRTCSRIAVNSISTHLLPRTGPSSRRQRNPRYRFAGC